MEPTRDTGAQSIGANSEASADADELAVDLGMNPANSAARITRKIHNPHTSANDDASCPRGIEQRGIQFGARNCDGIEQVRIWRA
jgi:hypothetical protein